MTMTYSVALKTSRMDAARAACADGTLELLTAADAVVVTHGLSATGGTVANGVWTLAFDAAAVAATASGTVAKARIKASGGAVVIDGLTVGVTGSGAEIVVQNTSVNIGQEVSYTGATITHG